MEDRLAKLEARLQEVEDRLAIYQLLASYGPAVDSLSESVVAGLWTADGAYDAGPGSAWRGAEEVGTLVHGETHQGYVKAGCAHVISLPHITIHGDTAVATGHSRLYLHDGQHWRVERASANRWELVRTPAGWRVHDRRNRPLNGAAEPRQLLARAFDAA